MDVPSRQYCSTSCERNKVLTAQLTEANAKLEALEGAAMAVVEALNPAMNKPVSPYADALAALIKEKGDE